MELKQEQMIYANILNIGQWIGLIILTITFVIYLTGILPCFVPIEELPEYWAMNVKDYIHTLNAPTGWGWITMLGKGDYLNFSGITILAGLTIICYLGVLPTFIKKKDKPYVIMVIIEVVILILAASSILKTGGH